MQSVPGIPSFPCLRANRRWLLTGIIALSIPAVLAHRGSPRLALWSLVVLLPLGSSLIWRWMRRLNGELQRSRWLVHHLLTDFAEEPADLRPPETVANSVADPIPTPPSQLLDCIMDGAAEAVLVVDPRGKVRLANDAARRLFGLPREGARGRPWDGGCRLMRRDTRTAYPTGQRPLDRALREEVVDLDVFQVNTPGRAGPAWVSCSARPLTAGGPDCGGAIMIARDITSLVHAEEQLLANEQRLHGLIDRLSAIIWTTDTELRITSIRGNGLVQLGKHPDELMNKTFFEVFHVDDPHFHPIAQQLQALRGTPRNYEWHWKGRDYTVSAEAIMGPDESITGTIGIALDVTESRNTSRQMAIAQQKAGMDYHDLNIGPAKRGGAEMMAWLVQTVQEVSDLPLFLDTTNVEAIEAGLRVHKGQAVINSISCRPERMDALFPLVKRYDACFVGLLIGVDGIPRDADERAMLAADMQARMAEEGTDPGQRLFAVILLGEDLARRRPPLIVGRAQYNALVRMLRGLADDPDPDIAAAAKVALQSIARR